jgi:hypothetical protein
MNLRDTKTKDDLGKDGMNKGIQNTCLGYVLNEK